MAAPRSNPMPKEVTELKPGTTHPCPGCGRPVLLSAAICTHCGQVIGKEEQLSTELKRAKKDGLPPIPRIAPGPAAFRDPGPDLDAIRMWKRAAAYLAFSMMVVLGWKFADGGAVEVAAYLFRFGVTLAAAWLIAAICAMMFIDFGVSWRLAAFGIAAALASGDFIQHTIATPLPLLTPLAWVLAMMLCVFCLFDLTDIDMPEAALLTFFIYLVKIVFKFTTFAPMFWKASTGEGG